MSSFLASLSVAAILASSPFHPWSKELLVGEWGSLYDEDKSASSMQYFRFDLVDGALWVQSYRGNEAMHFEFPADGIVEDNGLVILTATPSENFMVRFVVSAYRISEYRDSGLATGYLFMFENRDGEWMLFNSLPFRGSALEPDDPIFAHDELRPFVSGHDE